MEKNNFISNGTVITVFVEAIFVAPASENNAPISLVCGYSAPSF
jgi:hypothetical protein